MAKSNNIARNRVKAINEGQKRAVEELKSSGVNIMVTPPVYIHNSMENFLIAAPQANNVLSVYYNSIKTQWETEAQYLINICEQKESAFFSNEGSELNINSRKDLELALQEVMQTYELNLQLPEVKSGTKSISDMHQISNFVIKLSQDIQNFQVDEFDANFFNQIKTLKTTAENFNKTYPYESESTTGSSGQKLQYTEGLGIRNLMFHIIPGALERLYVKTLKEIGKEKIITSFLASKTQTGTTVDLEFGGIGFSIKNNKKVIQQSKQKSLQNFFDWNTNISQELSSVHTLMTTQFSKEGYTLQTILQYLLLNYGSFASIGNSKILDEAMKIIILTNLNEKMFGYNKKGQANLDFNTIIQKLPVAGLNNNGQIFWYKDVVSNLINKIRNDAISMKSLATYSITPGSYNRNALYQAKKEAISNNNNEQITYQWLKTKIHSALITAQNELASSVNIAIQYHLNIQKILGE